MSEEHTLVTSKEERECQVCCGAPGTHQMFGKQMLAQLALLSKLSLHISVKNTEKRDSSSNVIELTLCDRILTINSSYYGHLSPACFPVTLFEF